MDTTIFVGDITEWELKKRLDLKLQKLQKQCTETSCIKFEPTNKDSIEDLLNNLAYRCLVHHLSDSDIKLEIQKIMEEVLAINKPSEEILEESIQLDQSFNIEPSCSNSDGSFNFDDTMEEMERLLRDGLTSESDKCAVQSDLDSVNNIKFEEFEVQNVSAIEVEQFSCDYSKNYEKEQYSPLSTSSESVESKKSDAKDLPFKIPSSSCKKQILNGGANSKPQIKISTPVNKLYKDVVSPVAFYIKNSGVTPLRQHLKFTPEKHLFRNDLTESVYCKSVPNNRFPLAKEVVLPEVFYEPAVKKIVSQEHFIKLPDSINKLVGDLPEIVIHEHRIRKGERKPNRHTMNPNYSLADEDVSIYVTKQAQIH